MRKDDYNMEYYMQQGYNTIAIIASNDVKDKLAEYKVFPSVDKLLAYVKNM